MSNFIIYNNGKKSIDLDDINQEMQNNQVWMTKLFWLGNPRLAQHKQKTPLKQIELLEPKLTSKKPIWYYINYYRFQRLHWRMGQRHPKRRERHRRYRRTQQRPAREVPRAGRGVAGLRPGFFYS